MSEIKFKKSKAYELIRKKLFLDRTTFLREVKKKKLSVDELHFLSVPRKTIKRQEKLNDFINNPIYQYEYPFNRSLLNRLNALDQEIIVYQLLKKGYDEDDAQIIAENIISMKGNSFSYRSVDVKDYIINEDLTVVEKSMEERLENLKTIDFKMNTKTR